MKKKDMKKNNFKMEDKYGANLIEARRQEMEQILPGFYTQLNGVVIQSKPITNFSAK